MPGKKYASISDPKQYEALKRSGYDKSAAARISNASANKRRQKRKSTR